MISSNYLFHFTDTKHNLLSILKNGIQVRYSLEDFSYLESTFQIDLWEEVSKGDAPGRIEKSEKNEKIRKCAIPMVCFSDIPLSMVLRHTEVYGRYALGFKKQWGANRGINPICYITQDSDLASTIKTFNSITKNIGECNENYVYRNIFTKILRFTKPYEGLFQKGDYVNENYRFYDEREWRYVEKNDCRPFLSENKFYKCNDNDKVVRHLNMSMEDIQYILVDNKDEVKHFHHILKGEGVDEKSLKEVDIDTIDSAARNAESAA